MWGERMGFLRVPRRHAAIYYVVVFWLSSRHDFLVVRSVDCPGAQTRPANPALAAPHMFANRSSNVLRTTRRFCAAGSRFEWQTLPSGLRIKHVRLAAHGGLGRPPEGCFPCSTQVSDGNQGDEPVGDNQTIRVTYSTRLEDNTVLISNRVASFKVGSSSQVRHAPAPPTPPPPSCCRMSSCLWRALLRSARRLTRECGGCALETAGAHPHRVLPHGVPPP